MNRYFSSDRFDFASKTVDYGWLAFNDKLFHFLLYYFIAKVCYAAILVPIWILALGVLVIGILWEFFELVTGKDKLSWRDVVCDAVGIFLAIF
jgi:hypothetical protein